MVEFETLKSEEIEFGNNNFIEVARKRAISEDGENEFISLTRGWFTPEGERRYKRNFAVPLEEGVAEFITEQIPAMQEAEGLVEETVEQEFDDEDDFFDE